MITGKPEVAAPRKHTYVAVRIGGDAALPWLQTPSKNSNPPDVTEDSPVFGVMEDTALVIIEPVGGGMEDTG